MICMALIKFVKEMYVWNSSRSWRNNEQPAAKDLLSHFFLQTYSTIGEF